MGYSKIKKMTKFTISTKCTANFRKFYSVYYLQKKKKNVYFTFLGKLKNCIHSFKIKLSNATAKQINFYKNWLFHKIIVIQ